MEVGGRRTSERLSGGEHGWSVQRFTDSLKEMMFSIEDSWVGQYAAAVGSKRSDNSKVVIITVYSPVNTLLPEIQ